MFHAHIFRQLPLQFPHLRAHDIGARRHRIQDSPVHFLAEDLILFLKISKLHRFFRCAQNDRQKYGFANARPYKKQASH